MAEEKGLAIIDTLISWVQIFKIEAPHQTAQDFVDGIALAEILHEIDPVYFGPAFLDGFVQDCGSSWRLKMANLQRVLSRIQDFFLDTTGSIITAPHLLPDVRILSEYSLVNVDQKSFNLMVESVFKFLSLVAGCAVSCSRRQHFIEAILNLETDIQAGVMEAVQLVLQKSDEHFDSGEEVSHANDFNPENEDIRPLKSQLQDALHQRDEFAERIKRLELELSSAKLRAESVSTKVLKAELEDDSTKIVNVGIQRTADHEEIERLRDELERIDASREEWRQKAETAEHDAAGLRARVAELTAANRETKRLRDELDVARHAVERLAIAESQIEQLQRKVEQTSTAQRKLRAVEERLQTVINENSALQDQLNRLRTVSKRRSNVNDGLDGGSTPNTEKGFGDEDSVSSTLRLELLQKQFDEANLKLVDTREQLMKSLSENRLLVDENARLRQTAAEATNASYDMLPSLPSLADEIDSSSSNTNLLDDSDKDNLIVSLKSEIARRKNEAIIQEQRYKKYLERARAIVKLVSVTAAVGSSSSRTPSGTACDLNIGSAFVANSSALSLMRAQLRLLAENNNRFIANSPLQLNPVQSTNGSNGITRQEASI